MLHYRFYRGLFRLIAKVVLRRSLHIHGRNNVPKTGPVMIVSNHVATCDPPLVGAYIPRTDLYYMAKSEAFETPLGRYFVKAWHGFPVVRQSADRAALRHALELLAAGHILVMFPEGSRSPDHKIARPYPGVGFLARHSGVPIIPAAVYGSENALPKGRLIPRHATVHLMYGEPFALPERNPDGSQMSHQQSTDYMMSRVAELLPEEYRGIYGTQSPAYARSSPAA